MNYTLMDAWFVIHAGLQSKVLSEEDASGDFIIAIDSAELPPNNFTRMSLKIPRELLRLLLGDSGVESGGAGSVRLGSFVYNDMTGLFPGSLPGWEE